MFGNASYIFLDRAPEAEVPQGESKSLKRENEYLSNRLQETAKSFNPKDLESWRMEEVCWLFEYFRIGIWPQAHYTKVPFRDLDFDRTSTVATSGGALLVATVLEFILKKTQSFALEDLAETAVAKGYKAYKKTEDGTYISAGCKNVFFDKFVPSIYRLDVERAETFKDLLESIIDYHVPVIEVSNDVYKQMPQSEDTSFLIVLGYDAKGLIVFDPENEGETKVPYEQILSAIKAGWIFKKKKR